MGRIITCVLLFGALLFSSGPSVAAGRVDGVTKALRELEAWKELGPQTRPKTLEKCAAVLRRLERLWEESESRGDRIVPGLLDFLGRCVLVSQVPDGLIPGARTGVRGTIGEPELMVQAQEMLQRRLPVLRKRLAQEILLGKPGGEPEALPRRIAACALLKNDLQGDSTLALLATTRRARAQSPVPRPLMDAAIAALVGRKEKAVHLRFLDLLKRADQGEENFHGRTIERHFGQFQFKNDQTRVISAVSLRAAMDLESADWRRASRGVALAGSLPDVLAFPLLIGALESWTQRAQNKALPTRRLLGEITAQLEKRSGQRLGCHAPIWRSFWDAYLRGEAQFGGIPKGTRSVSELSFFGLRPVTDRVVFLLDGSGSMGTRSAGPGKLSRLERTASQMSQLLRQLGPATQFNVVIFSDRTQAWQQGLRPATEANVMGASRWISRPRSDRGTRLFDGVQHALGANRQGRATGRSPQADTVLVVCDGETQEGSTWVEPFMRRANDGPRIVFHTVQLGPGGDGTLEALAAQTGGQFQRFDD